MFDAGEIRESRNKFHVHHSFGGREGRGGGGGFNQITSWYYSCRHLLNLVNVSIGYHADFLYFLIDKEKVIYFKAVEVI